MSEYTKYMSVKQLATYLQLSEETIYFYVRNQMIPATKLGRHWRFERDEIDAWMTARRQEVAEERTVLVVDDDPAVVDVMQKYMRSVRCGGDCVETAEQALRLLEDSRYDLMLLDIRLPGMDGVSAYRQVREIRPDMPVVLMTAYYDGALMDQALELGPVTVLRKPVHRDAFVALLHNQNYFSGKAAG